MRKFQIKIHIYHKHGNNSYNIRNISANTPNINSFIKANEEYIRHSVYNNKECIEHELNNNESALILSDLKNLMRNPVLPITIMFDGKDLIKLYKR